MKVDLEQLKNEFIVIRDTRNNITNIFISLEKYLENLKKIYSDYAIHNSEKLLNFGLDSFRFQNKILDIEHEDIKRLFMLINNRLYCEYYKLYKLLNIYVKENIPHKKIIDTIKKMDTFPVYKDLEPYKQYNFDIIQDIHADILILLCEINDFILNKEDELSFHKTKQDIGLNINNFVTTVNYNIVIVKEKCLLFISYINFFHSLHTKYLKKLELKIKTMYNQLINDIHLDDKPIYSTNYNNPDSESDSESDSEPNIFLNIEPISESISEPIFEPIFEPISEQNITLNIEDKTELEQISELTKNKKSKNKKSKNKNQTNKIIQIPL
jgi:hypothetical protein